MAGMRSSERSQATERRITKRNDQRGTGNNRYRYNTNYRTKLLQQYVRRPNSEAALPK